MGENNQGRVRHDPSPCVNPKLCLACGGPLKRGATKYCGAACYRAVRLNADPTERFWRFVPIRPEEGCWIWRGSTSGGRRKNGRGAYGQFTVNGNGVQRHVGAHVYSYELAKGPVPDGLTVMHLCHQKLCVNPEHLEAGTVLQNNQASAEAGHFHVQRPSAQSITDAQCDEMLALYQAGMLQAHIALRYGVSKTFVCLLVKGKRRQYRPSLKKTQVA